MTPDALKHAVERIQMDEDMRARVLRRSLDQEKETIMKKKPKIAIIAAVAAAVAVLSVTAFAAVRSQVLISWTNENDTYETLSQAQEALAATGSSLTLPESFSNGYAFAGAAMEHQAVTEEATENDQTPAEFTDEGDIFSLPESGMADNLRCTYEKGDSDVSLSAVDAAQMPLDEENAVVAEVGGHKFCFIQNTIAVESTEAAAIEDGEPQEDAEIQNDGYQTENIVTVEDGSLVEGSGVTLQSPAILQWQEDGKVYTLTNMDGTLTQAELIQMALELCK